MSEAAAKVPALRFSVFEGEWDEKILSDVCTKPQYGMNAAATQFDGHAKYIRITDIDDETRAYCPNPLVSPDTGSDPKYKLMSGDLLFTRTGASTGKSYLYKNEDGDLYFAGFLIRFHVVKAISSFVYSLTLRRNFRKWVGIFSMRSGQPGINAEEYASYKFLIPTLPEQQKIADFLWAVDARVRLLQRRRDALSTYKNGMMQRLFAQTLRFTRDEGTAFPDWQEKRLGEIVSEKFANGVFNDPNLVGSGYRLINVKDMYEGNHIALHALPRVAISEAEFLKNKAVNGDIFFTRSSLVKEGIAYSNYVLDDADDVTFDGHLIRLRANTSLCLPSFLAAQLRNDSVRRQLVARGKTGTMTTIGQEDIATVNVALPHPDEQQKIADFLSALDDKIDAVARQIAAMQAFKKALLQKDVCVKIAL